jgi:hypothetical protein
MKPIPCVSRHWNCAISGPIWDELPLLGALASRYALEGPSNVCPLRSTPGRERMNLVVPAGVVANSHRPAARPVVACIGYVNRKNGRRGRDALTLAHSALCWGDGKGTMIARRKYQSIETNRAVVWRPNGA